MREKHRLGWRGGIIFVIVCVVTGLVVSIGIERAQATCAPARESAAALSCGAAAVVTSPRNGRKKYNRDKLGHFGKVVYTHKAKKVILRKLMHEQARQARVGVSARHLSRAGMWRNFTRNDTCAFRASSSSPNTASWTCTGAQRPWPDDADWDGEDVDAVICGGLAGIGIGGALAAGLTGPWTWVGIGAGFAACQWGDNWKRQVE